MVIFWKNSFEFLCIFKRTRTLKPKKRPKLVDIPSSSPITDTAFTAWYKFDGTGSGQPIKEYYREEVQNIMKKIIGRNPILMKNVYMAKTPIIGEYKLVRPEKLKELNEEANKILDRFLITIPLYTERSRDSELIVHEAPELAGYDTSKYVFTDVSNQKTISNRPILVRHLDGSLRLASWEVRDRVNIVYFGSDGQSYPPPLFLRNIGVLKTSLSIDKHLYILNVAASVCSPDDKYYINTMKIVFNDIIERDKYFTLEFSPFYGPLLYHAIVNNKYDKVILYYWDLINKKYTDRTASDYPIYLDHLQLIDYMHLYILLKPKSKTACNYDSQKNEEMAFLIFLKEMHIKTDKETVIKYINI